MSAPPIGSGGEVNPHPSSDPSIGTAGEIEARPFERNLPNAPPIGSGGATSTEGWDPRVGTANEGEEKKGGFFHNLFHRKH